MCWEGGTAHWPVLSVDVIEVGVVQLATSSIAEHQSIVLSTIYQVPTLLLLFRGSIKVCCSGS